MHQCEWQAVATELAVALRPYTLFREARIVDGRMVVDCAVPGTTLGLARRALDAYADRLFRDSHDEWSSAA